MKNRGNSSILNSSPQKIKEETKFSDIKENRPISITLKLTSFHFEKLFPLWVEKGFEISIKVSGNIWLSETEMISAKGLEDDIFTVGVTGNPIGCLIGRILGGDYFKIGDNVDYISPISGPLLLSINRANYTNPIFKVDLTICVENVYKISQMELESKMGWDHHSLSREIHYDSKSSLFNIVLYLNKLRTDPEKFIKIYLNQTEFKNSTNKWKKGHCHCFRENHYLSKLAREHAKELGNTGEFCHLNNSNENLIERIKALKLTEVNFVNPKEIIFVFNDDKTLSIITKLLLEENSQRKSNRNIILDPSFSFIGISTHSHALFKNICVIILCERIEEKLV